MEMNTGKRKTQEQTQEILGKIRNLIALGHSNAEIMNKLNIPRRTFYYYKKKVNEESAAEFQKKKAEDLAFDMSILRDRLSRMYKTAIDSCNDPVTCDIPKTLEIAQKLAINLFRLEVEGLKASGKYGRLDTIQKEISEK